MKLECTFKAHFDHTGSRVTARQCFLRTSRYVSQLVEPRFKIDVLRADGGHTLSYVGWRGPLLRATRPLYGSVKSFF